VVLSERRHRGRRIEREKAAEGISFPGNNGGQRKPWKTIDLEKAIASLPEGARTVFVLHDIEGYRHAEIAGLLGTAAGTSRAQLHWARKLLRERLGK
jgi:RNA polymerase sigma-70 factor (ECF subfamily)